jgi:hypothetical protein
MNSSSRVPRNEKASTAETPLSIYSKVLRVPRLVFAVFARQQSLIPTFIATVVLPSGMSGFHINPNSGLAELTVLTGQGNKKIGGDEDLSCNLNV